MVERMRQSCAWASTERGEVLTSAIGLPGISALLTSQSKAFFSEPGMPRAYSGDEINRPSDFRISSRSAWTASGGSAVSRSGLKAGRSAQAGVRNDLGFRWRQDGGGR